MRKGFSKISLRKLFEFFTLSPSGEQMKTANTIKWICGAVVGWGCLAVAAGAETPTRGALVLQFDDGWSSWRTLVAPELARAGGRATCFVNNQYIRSGRISLDDLRTLQNTFGWEIGSHAFTHQNAVRYVQQHGLNDWLSSQLDRSLSELRGAGLKVSNFVFPFNAYTPELGRAVRERGMGSYRKASAFAMMSGRNEEGFLPGTSFDLTHYVPVGVLRQWIDMAHDQGQFLFLYGHHVSPDAAFVTGRVVRVTAHTLECETAVSLPAGDAIVLVPDIARRATSGAIEGLTVEGGGRVIRTPDSAANLSQLTGPGSIFLIGPAYGTRLSDFAELVRYASGRLNFYTVSEVVSGARSVGEHAGAGFPTVESERRSP